MPARLDPALFAKSLVLVSSDIPPDMTLAQWRRQQQATVTMSRARRRRVLHRLRRRRAL
jgi:hypothetical protein